MKLRVIDGVSRPGPTSPSLTCATCWRQVLLVHRAWSAGAAGGVDDTAPTGRLRRRRTPAPAASRCHGRAHRPAFLPHRAVSFTQPHGTSNASTMVEPPRAIDRTRSAARARGRSAPVRRHRRGGRRWPRSRSARSRRGWAWLGDRRAGLQRHRHSANRDQRHVDHRVVDAGEAEDADAGHRAAQVVLRRGAHAASTRFHNRGGDGLGAWQGRRWCGRSAAP